MPKQSQTFISQNMLREDIYVLNWVGQSNPVKSVNIPSTSGTANYSVLSTKRGAVQLISVSSNTLTGSTVTFVEQSGNILVRLSYTANTSPAQKTGTIVLVQAESGKQLTLNVTQAGSTPTPTPTTLHIISEGGSFDTESSMLNILLGDLVTCQEAATDISRGAIGIRYWTVSDDEARVVSSDNWNLVSSSQDGQVYQMSLNLQGLQTGQVLHVALTQIAAELQGEYDIDETTIVEYTL